MSPLINKSRNFDKDHKRIRISGSVGFRRRKWELVLRKPQNEIDHDTESQEMWSNGRPLVEHTRLPDDYDVRCFNQSAGANARSHKCERVEKEKKMKTFQLRISCRLAASN